MSLTLVCLYIIIGLCFLLFINYKFLKIFITPNRKYSATATTAAATAAAAVAADANSNTSSVTNKNTVNNNLNKSNHNNNNKNNNNNNHVPPLNHHLHHTQQMSHHHTLAAVAAAATVTANSSRNDIWSIPGPLSIPFFGTKWIYLWKYKLSKIHEVYKDFKRDYGPIVLEVTPSGIPVVNLYNRQDIERVLRFPSKYPFRPPTEIVAFYRKMRPDRYASTGITNEQGESWHNLRTKLTSQITSPRVLQAFLPALNTICDDFIDLLRAKRDPVTNVVENFQDVVNLFGLEAVCTLMLGRRMGFLSLSPPGNVAKLAMAVKMLFITQRDSSYGFNMWKYVATKTYRDFVETEDTIYNIISEIVDTALNEQKSEFRDDESVNSVFWSILCEKDLDIRDKKSAMIDFIAAGIETLANTLIFVLNYVTTSRDEVLERIAAEFDNCTNEIDASDMARAVYTKACLQETYRICPTAFCLARILQEDATLSGYDVKAGTVILCQNMISCHDPNNFKNPDDYVPERWLIDETKSSSRSCGSGANLVVPFGVGKRQCPGRRFVEMELMLIVAKLARSFEISFCDKLEMEFEFLLAPKTPVNLILNERLF